MISVLALCADLATSLSLFDRTELRLRVARTSTVIEPSARAGAAFDVAMTPSLLLETHSRRTSVAIGYAPQLTLSLPIASDHARGAERVTDALDLEILHGAHAIAAWHARRLSVTAAEDAWYGELNFTYLVPGPQNTLSPDAPRQLAPADVARIVGSSTSLVAAIEMTRRLSFLLAPRFSVGGGIDAASRTLIPLQSTARADASLTYAATRRDSIGPVLGAWASRSTPRPCDPETGGPPTTVANPPTCASRIEGADGRLAYGRRLSRSASLSASAGAAVVRTRVDAGARPNGTVSPEASLSLQLGLAGRWPRDIYAQLEQPTPERWSRSTWAYRPEAVALAFGASVASVVDVRYVEPDSRASGWVGATWQRGRTTTTATVNAERSVPPTNISATAFGGATGVLWDVNERFDMGGGLRGAWQHEPALGSLFAVVLSAVFVWREPPMRL